MTKPPTIFAALALNLDADMLAAAFPLLADGSVGALEWSFDALSGANTPVWFTELLHAFSKEQRLIGHGVFFSLLSARWTTEQQQWLQRLNQLARQFSFNHVTEHFGFFTGQNFHSGAPLPVPYTAATLRIGQDRLCRISEACSCPVGLENLAFAYSLEEVKRHGEFLDKLLTPVNGFLILDLHNLYCQLHNFSISYEELIALYPLEEVREIHISGGSWADSSLLPDKKIRRDTHDDAVPDEVFSLLKATMPRCPHLKYVVLEQLGNGLQTEHSQTRFRQDFLRMQKLVAQQNQESRPTDYHFLPRQPVVSGPVEEDVRLYAQQQQLSHILETAHSYEEAHQRLLLSSLAQSEWQIEQWAPYMLETALGIAQKWQLKPS
ncbi:DUF692 domain-containing protein [Hymenobacter sp. BT18]|uniref:multinuclear nonheme iron-dependent oxidase n=1 Tax=Hymenobacter sp. BT18 TaxID=2835648 RepID=UPI00143EEAEE|nr:DUF692 family multinuclear iron-containing protein [Hymenobacter sp. BT18]QIX59917.1 DUF692 domain-containing protein [Hymenobacter sp. BT18]